MLGYRVDRPADLPLVDTPRARMVRLLGMDGSPALQALAVDERETLLFSLTLTLGRGLYHRLRFRQIVDLLAARRAETTGTVTWDTFAAYALFEAAAALGAVRLSVDEIIFITARLRGIDPPEIYKRWSANDVMTTDFAKRPDFNVPEVVALRTEKDWYDEMNDYRNVLHHRGWRGDTGGYYPLGSTLPEARSDEHNVMLVPDRASLVGKTRPHEWTYTEGRRLEDVVDAAIAGFERVIDKVCMSCWGGSVPPSGKIPPEELASIFVLLPRPIVLVAGKSLLLPVFSTEKSARAFKGFPPDLPRDLVEVLPDSAAMGQNSFTFTLRDEALAQADLDGDLIVALDSSGIDPQTMMLPATVAARLPLNQLRENAETEPIGIPQKEFKVERLYMWRYPPS
jgi:hypothetical protein